MTVVRYKRNAGRKSLYLENIANVFQQEAMDKEKISMSSTKQR